MEAIIVDNLYKRYRKAKSNAVDGISFDVKKGEFFALLGPNGAGKTTTISMLTTTLQKSHGEAKIAGLDIDKSSKEVRSKIGIIFQNPSLDLNLTAEENVRFHCILYGLYPYRPTYSMMPDAYKRRIKELATVLMMQDEIFSPVKTFSGGMKRKLEIVRSLMHKPEILFLDEPTSGLDPASRKGLWNYLMNVRKNENTTIFLTTHYLDEAENADRICVINNGKVIFLGSPELMKKTLLKRKLIVDARNKRKLLEVLKKYSKDIEGEGPYTILLQKNDDARKILSSVKFPLSLVDIVNPSLEEAYIQLITKEK